MKKAKKTQPKKANNKKNLLPIVSLVLGFVLGGALIGIGVYNNINASYNSFNVRSEEDLKKDIETKNNELTEIMKKRDAEYDISALSDEYAKLSRQMSSKENEIYDLEAELYSVKSGYYEDLKAKQYLDSVPLIVLGAVVIVLGMGFAMKISNNSKKNVILSVTEEK